MAKNKKKNVGIYIAGSVALTVGAMIVLPKIIDGVSEIVFNKSEKHRTEIDDDDDWGPEIVKKKSENDTNEEKE